MVPYEESIFQKLDIIEKNIITRNFKSDDIDYLINVLSTDNSQIVVERASLILSKVQSPDIADKVSVLLFSENAHARNVGSVILAQIWPASKEALEKLVEHPNKHIRKHALDILNMTQSPDAVEIIAKGLDDPEPNNVIAAVEYIGEYYESKYLDKIIDVMNRINEPMLISTALESLEKICDETCFTKLPSIISSIDIYNPIILPSFLRFLSAISRKEDIEFIEKAIEQKDVYYKELIDFLKSYTAKYATSLDKPEKLKLIKYTCELLNSEQTPSVNKYELVQLIARLEPDYVVSKLTELLDDKDKYIVVAVLDFIGSANSDILKSCKHIEPRILEIVQNASKNLEGFEQAALYVAGMRALHNLENNC
ncbi:MAG: HEAT repeat domain-containing protein [Fervidobacterium sp.]|uniref:HEAT repeat domain-containing protein n=1 Tax=Fervidobacterium sp. TaxID=1871331 RepID=UPI004049B92E